MAGEFATDFDGSSDYYARGADLTGNADGKLGTFSVWIRIDGDDDNFMYLLSTEGLRFYIRRTNVNLIQIVGRDAGNNATFAVKSNTAITASSTWRHILTSWNMATGWHFYLDDVSDKGVESTFDDDDLDYTRPNWGIGSEVAGGTYFNGAVAELYFAEEYISLSVEANRRKFISAAGKPVYLGASGELPTTNQPIIYAPDGNAVVNKGSGGVFVKNGAPVRIAGPGDKPSPAAKIYEVLRGS